jgi:hypothetical protein
MFMIEPSLLIRLLTGHVLCDFVFQTRRMVDQKEKRVWRSPVLYAHAALYAAVVFVAASRWGAWYWVLPLFFITHAFIDGWKAAKGNRASTFFIDQTAHLAILIIAYGSLAQGAGRSMLGGFERIWTSPRPLIIVLGYLIVLWPVGRLMSVLTEPFRRQLAAEESRGLDLAGLWIGCLERTFLMTFLLLDYLSGIALLLGLKSLFRFGEIKDPTNRKETEYILIGTLLSLGFALTVGLAVQAMLRALP